MKVKKAVSGGGPVGAGLTSWRGASAKNQKFKKKPPPALLGTLQLKGLAEGAPAPAPSHVMIRRFRKSGFESTESVDKSKKKEERVQTHLRTAHVL